MAPLGDPVRRWHSFLGFGSFVGGTLRLAIPSMIPGFLLGIFIGIMRLARQWWIRMPATLYVEFFRGVPLVMVILWIWLVIPIVLKTSIPEFGVALTVFVIFEAAYLGEIVRAGIQSVARGQVEAGTALGLSGSLASLLALLDETYCRQDWLADCRRIRCPVQVIAGSEDSFPTVEMSRRLALTIPDGRLHVVQGEPHFPNRTHRAEVQGVIGRFFDAIGLSPPG